MPAVFISYSRRDKDFVARLHEALSARQYDVWVDWEDIPPVAEWFEEVRAGVGAADGFVYVISPDSVDSDVCQRELAHAVEQHKRIVPIVRREPDSARVPQAAAELNWIFLRDGDDFDHGLEQLVGAIEKDLEHVSTHTRLGIAANRWQSSGRESSQLLRGAELAAAESWLVAATDKQPEATQLQAEYVLAGRQAATRRQRAVIAAVTVALAIAAVLAVVALIERSSAISARNLAFTRQLDADAQSQYTTNPELSILLAQRAAQLNPASSTEEALREALAQSYVRVRYTLDTPEAGDALWSPDGSRLLVTSPAVEGAPGWARIYTPESHAAPVTLGSYPAFNGQSGWDARGDRIVIGGRQPAVYDAATGRLVAHVPGSALFAALTPDGSRVVTVDLNSVGHVYEVASGRQLATFHPHYNGGTSCMALSPDGSVVAQCDLGSTSGTTMAALDTWSTSTGRLIHSVASPDVIGTVAFSPDSSRYVFTTPVGISVTIKTSVTALARAVGLDGTYVYETHSGKLVKAFPGAASAAVFSPIAKLQEVAYATIDGLGHVYSFLSGVNIPLAGSTDVINSLSFNAAGTDVVAASRDDDALIFDASVGGLALETLAGHGSDVTSASFGLDGTAVATSSKDGTVRVWATPTPRPSAVLPAAELARSGDSLTASIGFIAGGGRIVQAGTTGHGQVLDARNLKVLARFAAPPGDGFVGAGVSRDGRIVAALSGPLVKEQGIYYIPDVTGADLYDAANGRLTATIRPVSPGRLLQGGLDYTGDRLVTLGLGGSSDVWSMRSGRLLYHLPGSTAASAAAFSRDGSLLAIAHYPKLPRTITSTTLFGRVTVDLYDARSGRHERTIVGEPLMAQEEGGDDFAPLKVAINPAGTLLAVGGVDEGVEVYSTSTGKLLAPLGIAGASGGTFAASLAFSPNGKLLAAGSVSGTYVWRLPSYIPYPTFEQVPAGETNGTVGVYGVQVGFTQDSQFMLTTGDYTLEAWQPADHLQLFHAYPIIHGNMTAQGTQFVTAGAGGLALYPCDLCGGLTHLLSLARHDTTRGFTASERATYLTQG